MARKKKSPKEAAAVKDDSGACGIDNNLLGLPHSLHRCSKDDNLMLHASDSELSEIKQLEKNKSNLFLIKSYSFIDKTNARRPNSLNIPQKLQEFENYHTLLLEESSPVTPLKEDHHKAKEKFKETKKNSKKSSKLGKMKKSKSTYDSLEDLSEFQDILRKPTVILDCEPSGDSSKRPLTFVVDNPHKPVVKSKTMEDIAPLIKRESFIRHSLQSIRRSFSSSKKSQISSSSSNNSSSACSSASSTSSSSSSGGDPQGNSLKKSKNHKNKDKTKIASEQNNSKEDAIKATPKRNGEYKTHANEPELHNCNQQLMIENTLKASMPQQPIVVISSPSPASSMACLAAHVTLNAPNAMPANSNNNNNSNNNAVILAVLQEEDEKDLQNPLERSTSSVSTLAQLPTDSLGSSSMAPLQTHTEAQSVQCLNSTQSYDHQDSHSPTQATKRSHLQHQQSIAESLESTSIGCATSSEYSSARSLKHSTTSLAPLQSVPSSTSLRSISPSRRSASSNSSSTAKHEQSPAANTAAGAAVAAATTSAAIASGSSSGQNITPPEKEKKRKEVSSSRVKKFQRHFSQVSQDEKLINYFSCALVSDILLQGHLYITDQHFAFYSNVFGYVTKVVIPTSSVTKISKEKTAKIIPNAVGVATADERHVFGSFISREAAFRLMCSVCPPLDALETLVKDPASIEISEEYSVEDDSSCSISGNESPAQATDNANSTHDNSQTILRRSVANSSLSIADSSAAHKQRHSDIPLNAKTANNNAAFSRASAPPVPGLASAAATAHYANGGSGAVSGHATVAGGGGIGHVIVSSINGPATAIGCPSLEGATNLTFIAGNASTTTSATSTPTPSTSSSPTTVMALPHTKAYQILNKFRTLSNKLLVNLKFPTEIHVVYLGAMLTVLLAVFTIFLLYRILDIEAKTNVYRSPIEFKWQSANDDDIFAEALRFQKQLQVKSTEEAQNILKTNLEQIAKVRRSLETLSMLIHDRSSSFDSTNPDDSD
ncbi:uncharacterized protein LOC106085140 isoform X1 [Stomoxys calcitrans]|uniref:uncharacterized protein LOC106085140 isoform X1 n=1 Tax=Stomoxys calcitrans TaxID=35570 RepID=UPI0027E2569E|nr:uncharacterized protein LOC106085140 isoform X1 [Stomoxys calcitrans]XP_059224312.1 uncharacterized protein LOC106085140 isoform X1 [Stomoxys calcitrans]